MLTLVAFLALAQTPPHWLFRQPNLPQGESLPAFSAFGVSGRGTSGACSTTPPTGAKGETLIFTRSTVKWCTNDDYSLTQMAIDQPVIMRGRPGAPLGIFVEQDATNLALYGRDGSQAIWVKTNATCTKTATGPDGVTNSATTCTSTSSAATVLQSLVRASAANSTSFYVRRRTGLGAVAVTADGTNFYDITSRLTGDWKRVVCKDAEGCMGGRCIIVPQMCVTSANPVIGWRISTSGDAIDFDFAQNETGKRASSVIATTATSFTRRYDSPRFALGTKPALMSWSVSQVASSIESVSQYLLFSTQGSDWAAIFTGTGLPVADSLMNIGCNSSIGGVQYGASPSVPLAAGGMSSTSCVYSATARTSSANGVSYSTTPAPAFSPGSLTVEVGHLVSQGTTFAFNGVLSEICVDTAQNCARTRVLPTGTHIAWFGDSITAGIYSTPTFPPLRLYTEWAQYDSRGVQNFAIGGGVVSLLTTQWAQAKTAGFGSVVILIGVNDLKAGATAATIWASLEPIYDEALSLGLNVTPVTVLPWGNWADGITNWSPAKQAETEALNALILQWCSDNSKTCVDAYSAFGEPGTPIDLAAIYDSGDGLHPNAAGSILLAQLVQAANP